MNGMEETTSRLERARLDFDAGFARASAVAADPGPALLSVQVAGRPFALPAAALLAVGVLPRLTALPHAPPELLGLAGHRGRLVAVYDLARLLGLPERLEARTPGWLIVLRDDPTIALAVDALQGWRRVRSVDLAALTQPGIVQGILTDQADGRGLVDLQALLDSIAANWRKS